jgi:hypothetical protein
MIPTTGRRLTRQDMRNAANCFTHMTAYARTAHQRRGKPCTIPRHCRTMHNYKAVITVW